MVLFNGEQVGTVQTFDETWRHYTFRLPYAAAGVTNTLMFQGINSMHNQLGTPGAYKNLIVHLAAGSKLALDFSGQASFKELRYDGRLYSGELDASNTPFITGAGSVYVSPKGTKRSWIQKTSFSSW